MAGAGRTQVVLASEAARRRVRQQQYALEQEKLFTTLLFPEKLKALAEPDSSQKPASPKSPLAFVNRAFNADGGPLSFPNPGRRASVDAVASVKSTKLLGRSPHRRNASLDALDKVDLLAPPAEEEPCSEIEACEQRQQPVVAAPKQQAKRVYVSRPLVPRRFSADERPCVTIFSSEPVAKPKMVMTPPPRPTAPLVPRRLAAHPSVKLREKRGRETVVDGPQRVLSYPNLDAYDTFKEDLKYWRDVLHNSPQLRALEKR